MTIQNFETAADAVLAMKGIAQNIAALFEADGAEPQAATEAAFAYIEAHKREVAAINAAGKSMYAAEPPADVVAARADMQQWMMGKIQSLTAADPALGAAFGGVIAKMKA